MPEPQQPPHIDHTFHASFEVGEDGRLQFPITTRDLVVRAIELLPKPDDEQFHEQLRWFVYPAGTTVHARGQLRAYANHAGVIPDLKELLPNAKVHSSHGAQ